MGADVEKTDSRCGGVVSNQGRRQPGASGPFARPFTASSLGDARFRRDYNVTYAYVVGAMYRGVSSKEMVVKLGRAGIMGFYGAGGLDLAEVESSVAHIAAQLSGGEPYGVNLLHNPNDPGREERKVELFLRHGVKNVEASAYLTITPAVVRFRAEGLRRQGDGCVSGSTRIIAKVSRPEIAEAFLSPAPAPIVECLTREGKITAEQAELLREIPVADDLCAEADSGGHTDGAVAYALVPTMMRLRDELSRRFGYRKRIRVGAAGGIGTPEAAAAAFVLGADFVVTGSINQCTVEARTSDAAKDMLQRINIQDTDYAPAGDMFELGAKVQVMKKGVFFPARANKLHELYRRYGSLEDIDEPTRKQLEEKYFRRTFGEVLSEVTASLSRGDREQLERHPKQKMALVFKWYFQQSSRLALEGVAGREVDYQIHCGPALGAFNQWVKGTPLADWRNRKVDEIGEKLMLEAARLLNERLAALAS